LHEVQNVPRFALLRMNLAFLKMSPASFSLLPKLFGCTKRIKTNRKIFQSQEKSLKKFKKFLIVQQNKSKEISSSKGHSSASTSKSDLEQTSINLSNDTESIKKQEPKKQVNIVISYIEQNDEQGIGQSVKLNVILSFF
jgi:hypothetical protein